MGHEAHAHAVPAELRDVLRQRGELHQHVGLVGVDDQQPAAAPRRSVAGDKTVDVLTRGCHRDELAGAVSCQFDKLLLDLCFTAKTVRVARRAQRRAFDQQPIDAVQALVGEHVLEPEAGAAVGPQVAGVEQALAVGLDEQGARIGRRVVDGNRRHREAAEAAESRRSGSGAGLPAERRRERTRGRPRGPRSCRRCRRQGWRDGRGGQGRSGRGASGSG